MVMVSLVLGARAVRDETIDYAKVDLVREAMMPVLQRHGYEIPGIADLCAIAAVRAMNASMGRVTGIEITTREVSRALPAT